MLYPGIQLPGLGQSPAKKRQILGCGFFSQPAAGESYSYKRQEVLLEAFRRLCRHDCGPSLELHLAGHVAQDAQGSQIMQRLGQLSEGLPVVFHPNCSGQELQGLYQDSSIFWHATGYAIDAQLEPFRLEHFGMVTVEAMSWGCVPVVYGQGGQREIVEDGQSGFWWSEIDQLVESSLELLQAEAKWAAVSAAARRRADFFSAEQFAQNALAFTEAEVAGLKKTRAGDPVHS